MGKIINFLLRHGIITIIIAFTLATIYKISLLLVLFIYMLGLADGIFREKISE